MDWIFTGICLECILACPCTVVSFNYHAVLLYTVYGMYCCGVSLVYVGGETSSASGKDIASARVPSPTPAQSSATASGVTTDRDET